MIKSLLNKLLIVTAGLSMLILATFDIKAANPNDSTLQISVRANLIVDSPEPTMTQNTSVPDIDIPEIAEWQKYIEQPFSKMTDKKLKQIGKQLETLPDCRSVRLFRIDYNRTLELKAELDSYWEVAKRPYNFEEVEDTKEKVFQMESKVNPQQAEDIHNGLLTALVRFRNGGNTLKEIVVAFEAILEKVPKDAKGKYIRQPNTKKEIVTKFEEVISQHKESIKNRIGINPYLRSLYSGYVDGMRMNPFNTGLQGVRNQIMSQNLTIPE